MKGNMIVILKEIPYDYMIILVELYIWVRYKHFDFHRLVVCVVVLEISLLLQALSDRPLAERGAYARHEFSTRCRV